MKKLYYAGLALLVVAAGCEDKDDVELTPRPAVFVMTNASTNAVVIFNRSSNGALTRGRTVATGGSGLGADLESEHSLILSDNNRLLFAANAGSNDITVFRIVFDSLLAVQKISSGGTRPVSITNSGNIVYVLNQGSRTITGFSVAVDGTLTGLNVTRNLTGNGAAPAQIEFSRDGRLLVVSEPDANVLDVFVVDASGVAGQAIPQPSNAPNPFGLGFNAGNQLIVANANFNTPNGGVISEFNVSAGGALAFVDSIQTNQSETTHLVLTNNGSSGFASNRGSNSVSGFSTSGTQVLLVTANGVTATTGNRPEDLALTVGNQFLYVLNTGDDTISSFRVNSNGTLSAIATTANSLPSTSYGLAAL